MTDTIIQFPVTNKRITQTKPEKQESLGDVLESTKQDLINDQVDFLYELFVQNLNNIGLTDVERIPDCDKIFLYEVMNACVHRYYKCEHPLHEMAADVCDFKKGDEIEESTDDTCGL